MAETVQLVFLDAKQLDLKLHTRIDARLESDGTETPYEGFRFDSSMTVKRFFGK